MSSRKSLDVRKNIVWNRKRNAVLCGMSNYILPCAAKGLGNAIAHASAIGDIANARQPDLFDDIENTCMQSGQHCGVFRCPFNHRTESRQLSATMRHDARVWHRNNVRPSRLREDVDHSLVRIQSVEMCAHDCLTPNGNKLSHRWREQASIEVGKFSSCEAMHRSGWRPLISSYPPS